MCGLPYVRACARAALGNTSATGGNRIMDLLAGFVGLVAFIALLACLSKVGHTLSALESASVVTELFLSFFSGRDNQRIEWGSSGP